MVGTSELQRSTQVDRKRYVSRRLNAHLRLCDMNLSWKVTKG